MNLKKYTNKLVHLTLTNNTFLSGRIRLYGTVYVINNQQIYPKDIKTISLQYTDNSNKYKTLKSKNIEPHIYQITKLSNITKETFSKYEVRFAGTKLHTFRRFKTLDEARNYRDLCEAQLNKFRISSTALVKSLDVKDMDYPETLLRQLLITPEEYNNYYSYIEPNFEDNFRSISHILNSKEQIVINALYKDHRTLESVGNQYGVTRERIRQIGQKAITKLRNSKEVKEVLVNGKDRFALISKEEHDLLYQELKDKMTYELALEIIKEHNKQEQNISIDDLDLSVRAYNCLKRANINTLNDLLNYPQNKLRNIKSLGNKCYKELLNIIKQYKKEDMSIESLNLSVRSYNGLKRQNINTINDLLKYNEQEVLRFKNLGQLSLIEIKTKLLDRGYALCD